MCRILGSFAANAARPDPAEASAAGSGRAAWAAKEPRILHMPVASVSSGTFDGPFSNLNLPSF